MQKISFALLFIFCLHLGISAPQNTNGTQPPSASSKKTKTQQSLSAMTTPQSVGDEIVKYFGRKTGKELMAEKAGATKAQKGTKVPGGNQAASSSVISPKVVPAVKPGYVPLPPTPRASVPQIRQEIQRILELNKKIKSVQSGSAVQLQRVQEQARIHEKILVDLENAQAQTSVQKVPLKTALLAQEKIRIIHEETQRNAKMIEGLKAVTASPAPKVTSKAKPAAS
jgi:hypothetical protein